MMRVVMAVAGLWCGLAGASNSCSPFVATMTREAHYVFGIDAPVPVLMGQIRQESACRPNVTAWDNGRGLAQFMDATAAQVSRSFPDIGAPDPYSPAWAIRALVRYDGWLLRRVKADSPCDGWGAALAGYNGGLGYVLQSEAASGEPGRWFGVTERVPSRQSAANFAYARSYPRKIIFQHQAAFAESGRYLCKEITP
jgi:soluble lytic murein transglycosylase-like protein